MLKRVLHTAQQIVTHEEHHIESVMENTVNAPAKVTVKADGWQGKTDGVNVYAGGDITTTWENAEDESIAVHKGAIQIKLSCGDIFANGGFVLFDSDIDVGIGANIQMYCYDGAVSKWGSGKYVTIRNGRNAILLPEYSFADGQTTVGLQIRKYYATELPGTPYTFTLSNIMVKAGQEEHEYEPYTGGMPSPSPAYPQDVISTSGVLKATNNGYNGDKLRESQITIPTIRRLPDGTHDTLYVDIRNKKAWVERCVCEYAIKGTESLTFTAGYYDTGSSTNVAVNVEDIRHEQGNGYGYCSDLPFLAYSWNITDGEGYCYNNEQIHLRLPNTVIGISDDATSDEKKQAWINYVNGRYNAGNPIIVLYPLAEPIINELPYSDYILRTAQYHTELIWEGLDEHLKPEVEIVAKHIGR